MEKLSSTAIFHLQLVDTMHVIGETQQSEGKSLLSPLTILKTWMLPPKVKDMEDILIKSHFATHKMAFYSRRKAIS
jgi:hypothetical protein